MIGTWLPGQLVWIAPVVAVGLGGAIAMQPAASTARGLRALAVAGLALLALLGTWLVSLAVPLAIGVVDTVALRRGPGRGS